jgi:cell division protein ZapA
MGQVTATVNGHSYTLSCGDGEEPRLRELLAIVQDRAERLTMAHGPIPDARMLLMVALLVADDLVDARARIAALEAGDAMPGATGAEHPRAVQPRRDKAG